LAELFKLKPEEAVKYLENKGYKITANWRDMMGEAHRQAFTVAKATKADMLQDIRGMLDKALTEGTSLHDFKKELTPKLEAKGFFGKRQITKADGTTEIVNVTPSRLDNIFRTNVQSAYNAGREKQMAATADVFPLQQFLAISDDSTTDVCNKFNGKVFRADDPIWDKYTPPLHFKCRSTKRSMSERAAAREGVEVSEGIAYEDANDVTHKQGFDYNPAQKDFMPDVRKYDPDIAAAAVSSMLGLMKTEYNDDGIPSRADHLEEKKDLGGSTGAKLLRDPITNRLFVAKQGASPEHITSEHLADEAYRTLGADVPRARLIKGPDGNPMKVAEYIDGQTLGKFLKKASAKDRAAIRRQVQGNFVADALLGNWDVVGLNQDKFVVADGKAYRVDNGGALGFRAQGATKKLDFDPNDILTMRDPYKSTTASAKIFQGITESRIVDQIKNISANKEKLLASLPQTAYGLEVKQWLTKRIERLERRVSDPNVRLDETQRRTIAVSLGVPRSATLSNTEIDDLDRALIVDYSVTQYGHMNAELRFDSFNNMAGYAVNYLDDKRMDRRDALNHALSKLPKRDQPVRSERGVSIPVDLLDDFLADHETGSIIHSNQFLSTSRKIGFSGNVIMIFKTKQGKDIAPYSSLKDEEEELVPAGARFKVTKVVKNSSKYPGRVAIYLQDAD
jgi:SPP1 gp7 family putative phage head morphogenesis protein